MVKIFKHLKPTEWLLILASLLFIVAQVWLDLKLMLLTLKVLITPDSTEGVEANQVTALKNEEKSDASDEENDSE